MNIHDRDETFEHILSVLGALTSPEKVNWMDRPQLDYSDVAFLARYGRDQRAKIAQILEILRSGGLPLIARSIEIEILGVAPDKATPPPNP